MNALTAKEAEVWTSEMARVANMTIRGILGYTQRGIHNLIRICEEGMNE